MSQLEDCFARIRSLQRELAVTTKKLREEQDKNDRRDVIKLQERETQLNQRQRELEEQNRSLQQQHLALKKT